MSERIYKITRLGPGDYLLPSNDAKDLWRLARYTEEWFGVDDRTSEEAWGIWRWRGYSQIAQYGFPTLDELTEALSENDWQPWEFWAGPYAKRAEAIESALR